MAPDFIFAGEAFQNVNVLDTIIFPKKNS